MSTITLQCRDCWHEWQAPPVETCPRCGADRERLIWVDFEPSVRLEPCSEPTTAREVVVSGVGTVDTTLLKLEHGLFGGRQ